MSDPRMHLYALTIAAFRDLPADKQLAELPRLLALQKKDHERIRTGDRVQIKRTKALAYVGEFRASDGHFRLTGTTGYFLGYAHPSELIFNGRG